MKNNTCLELHFSTSDEISLEKTFFSLPHFHSPIKGLRYASSASPIGFSGFKWRSGMIAVSILFLQAKLNNMQSFFDRPVLEGLAGSVANGVDIALSKPQLWFFDLFGYDSRGNPLLRRLVTVSNSRLRRGKNLPIKIFFKYNTFNPKNVKVFLDHQELTCPVELKKLINSLEEQYEQKRQSSIPKSGYRATEISLAA